MSEASFSEIISIQTLSSSGDVVTTVRYKVNDTFDISKQYTNITEEDLEKIRASTLIELKNTKDGISELPQVGDIMTVEEAQTII